MGFDDERQDWSKYEGFRVHWDKELRTFVFDSKEERDRWQIKEYGQVRDCFRTAVEREDGRPLIYYTTPPFTSAEEEARYLRAIRMAPPSQYGAMKLDEYLAEIVKLAEGIKPGPAVRSMPEAGPLEAEGIKPGPAVQSMPEAEPCGAGGGEDAMREILLSKRPDDPDERDAWVKSMTRLQFAMWVDDGAKCEVCGRPYASTDDMLNRNPRHGGFGADGSPKFIDDSCFSGAVR